VKGAVGIGKTRLVRAVLNDIRGKEIIWSNCVYFAETVAYHPIKEAIRYRIQRLGVGIVQDVPSVYKYELAKLIPDLAGQISEKAVNAKAVMDKYRLYEGIRKVIETGDRPKILIFDNIHWVDNESVQVIKYLIRSLREHPLSFVFVYRIEEMTELLEDFMSSISREIGVTEIEVKSFTDAEIKESVKSIIGDEPDETLVRYVVRESGGIPFYIEEIARNLSDKKYLSVEENQWMFHEPDEEIIPVSLEAIEVRKFRSLGERTQEVLAAASAIGWFDIGIIGHITGYSENDIISLINDVSRLGMIKYGRDRFEFAEEISRHAIYSKGVDEQKKKQLHHVIAQKIEEQSSESDRDIAEVLALHYYRSKDKDKGITYCMAAGDRAQEKYAHQDATRYYTWALELLEEGTTPAQVKMRIDCLIKRATVFSLAKQYDAARDDIEQAVRDAEAIHDEQLVAEIQQKKDFLLSKESPA
jgi:predicted ATPase